MRLQVAFLATVCLMYVVVAHDDDNDLEPSTTMFPELKVSPKFDESKTSSDTCIREGSDVSLRCHATGNPAPIITWRREGQNDSQAKMGLIFMVKRGEYLNITKVSRRTMGAYRCIASNGVQPSVSKRIMLYVTFAPIILVSRLKVRAPLESDVELSCGVQSFPPAIMFWMKEDTRIQPSSRYAIMPLAKGIYKSYMRLRINNLKPEDYGLYTCFDFNSLGEKAGAVKLYEIPRPTAIFSRNFTTETSKRGATSAESEGPSFAEPIKNTTIAAGRDVILPCVVNNLGISKVAWIHTDKHTLLTLHDRVITRNTRYSITHNGFRTWWLNIKDVEESDKGEYMCQVNTIPMISQSGYLEVVVPPKIDENNTSSDTDVREGSDINLRCQASGSPAPKINWRREDQKDIQSGSKIISSMNGEFLNISKVSRLHMAAYLCIASNGVQPSVSKRIMLNVKFAPMIWIPNQLVGAPLDTEVVIVCHLESFPRAVSYWKKEDGVIILSNSKYDSMVLDSGNYKSEMKLRIRDLKPEDYTSYTCVAKNSLGETEGSIKIYEIPRPTTTSSPAPLTSKTSKTESTQHTTSEKMLLGTWQNSIAKEDTESARKAELSTELLEKQSTIGGIAAAAAASDHEYREQGAQRKESRRRINNGESSQSSSLNFQTHYRNTFILLIALLILKMV